MGVGGLELAPQPRDESEPGLTQRLVPLPLYAARAQEFKHVGRPIQVSTGEVVAVQGAQCREQLVVAQIGPA